LKSGLINDDRFSSEEILSFEHDKKIKDVKKMTKDKLCFIVQLEHAITYKLFYSMPFSPTTL
jgi:hypothetical protein